MKKFLVALALLACFEYQAVYAEDPVESELEAYRLPKDVIPEKYEITLTMSEDSAKVLNKTFSGDVTITLKEIGNSLEYIKLHRSKEMKINSVDYCQTQIFSTSKAPSNDEAITYDEKTEIMSINIKGKTCVDPPTLKITFESVLYDDMYGFYVSTFKSGETTHTFATTQFQATYARRAFPCFDEPSFKATFKITIKHPEGYTALSNQPAIPPQTAPPEGRDGNQNENPMVCTTFEETVPMSTYIVAFIVYPTASYECGKVTKTNDLQNDMQICAPKRGGGGTDTKKYAMDKTAAIVKQLNTFTGIDYDAMKPKSDADGGMKQLFQVAIPDFAAGAMENWGLLTYRETALLFDEKDSTSRDKQRISSVMAHEIAHQWFGDLVTLDWWDATWLNEGFARYFEYHVVDEIETEWQMADQFVIEQMHSIFQQDVTGALALTSKVYTQSGIKSKFGSITYNKGACIVRMLEKALTDESCDKECAACKAANCNDVCNSCKKFKNAIHNYLTKNSYKNTKPEDLFNKLEASETSVLEKNVDKFMNSWTTQSGYPVVQVSLENKKLVFKQEQFKYKTDDTSKNLWYVPISYYFEGETKSTTPKTLLKEATIKVDMSDAQAKAKFVLVNVDQTGYYRVHYSPELLKQLVTALSADSFSGISEINRAQIVDDMMNLARVGKVDYKDAFDAIEFLAKDKSYFSWYAAFNGFSYLRRRLPEGELKEKITEKLSTLMDTVYNAEKEFKEKKEEKQIEIYKKVLILQWACEINKSECRKNALEIFKGNEGKPAPKAETATDTSTPANLRKIVYCEAARENKENWNKLWTLFGKTESAANKVTILTALGCSADNTVLDDYLKKSITKDSGIRKQDAYSVFTAVMTGSPLGIDIALDFLIEKYADIRLHYTSMNALSTVITSVADRLTTPEQAKKFTKFLDENEANLDDAKDIIDAAKATVNANQEWVTQYEKILNNQFDTGTGMGNSIISFSFSLMVFITLSINYLF